VYLANRSAAVSVLDQRQKGGAVPARAFDRRLHQPLHVGSVYLDTNGKLVDPDVAHKVDPDTETIGGNAIQDGIAIRSRRSICTVNGRYPTDLATPPPANCWTPPSRSGSQGSPRAGRPLGDRHAARGARRLQG